MRLAAGATAALATPKSTSFTMPSYVTRMFCGETSRCTRPSELPSFSSCSSCAACRPGAGLRERCAARAGRDAALALRAPCMTLSGSPSIHSIDQVEDAVLLAEVEDLGDVRVADLRGERAPRRGTSARTAVVLDERRQHRLDGDDLLEAARALQARRPHRGHAACAIGSSSSYLPSTCPWEISPATGRGGGAWGAVFN